MSTTITRIDNQTQTVESEDQSTTVLYTGTPGPNTLRDSTTVSALTESDAAPLLLSTNSAGNRVRKVTIGSVVRSLITSTTQSAARSAIDAEQSGVASAAMAAHLAALNPHTQYPLLSAANTFAAGPQVFVGGATVRQSGGVAGTDEVQISHDGADSLYRAMSGKNRQQSAGAFEILNGSSAVMQCGGGSSGWFDSYGFRVFSSTPGSGTVRGEITGTALGVVGLTSGGEVNGATLSSIPLTPSQITSNQNNYAPGVARFYRLSTDASRDITGLSCSQVSGQECEIWNVGSNNIVLKHQDANSTAANRFLIDTGADLTIQPNSRVELRYDSTQSRWVVASPGGLSIGSSVTSGTSGRVLYVGAGPVLAQDAGLTYDPSTDTLTSGPHVAVGTVTVRQSGGVAGVDDLLVYHDGTHAYLEYLSGSLRIKNPFATATFTNGDLTVGALTTNQFGAYSYGAEVAAGKQLVFTAGSLGFGTATAGLALDSAGVLRVTNASAGVGDMKLSNLTATGVNYTGSLIFAGPNSGIVRIGDPAGVGAQQFHLVLRPTGVFAWAATGGNATSTPTTGLAQASAGTVEVNNGTATASGGTLGSINVANLTASGTLTSSGPFKPSGGIYDTFNSRNMYLTGNYVVSERAMRVEGWVAQPGFAVLTAKGASGQTGNLFQAENNGGTVLAGLTAAGRLLFNAADTAPADGVTPAQWITCTVNGVQYRLPLYL